MAALCNRAGHYIFALWFLLLSSFSIFLPRLISAAADWMYFYTWCGLSANLGCRSEMCCTRLVKIQDAKKSPKICHLSTIARVAVSSQLRHMSTIGKNLSNSNIFSTCSRNMVNFGPLTAEIGVPVWGTLAHFNGLRVLALHGTPVMGVGQTLRY